MTNQNSISSELEIGMGATIQFHSDRIACTVIDISPSGHQITLQEDQATRTDNNGFSESQSYTFNRNKEGQVYLATLRKDGRYRLSGAKETVTLGIRDKYYDFSF